MFSNIKSKIKEIAVTAVKLAEESLGSNTGRQKKIMAINYIVSKLPVPFPFNQFLSMILSSFIDDAVEFAVQVMKDGGINGRTE